MSRQNWFTWMARRRLIPITDRPISSGIRTSRLSVNSTMVLPRFVALRGDAAFAMSENYRVGGIPPGEPSIRSDAMTVNEKGRLVLFPPEPQLNMGLRGLALYATTDISTMLPPRLL